MYTQDYNETMPSACAWGKAWAHGSAATLCPPLVKSLDADNQSGHQDRRAHYPQNIAVVVASPMLILLVNRLQPVLFQLMPRQPRHARSSLGISVP